MTNSAKMSEMNLKACIDACSKCHEVCSETALYCLEKGGKHATHSHITLLLNCAAMCSLTLKFVASGSHFHAKVSQLCAEICEACAVECEALGDETMKKCAEVCRQCARSCKEMAA